MIKSFVLLSCVALAFTQSGTSDDVASLANKILNISKALAIADPNLLNYSPATESELAVNCDNYQHVIVSVKLCASRFL